MKTNKGNARRGQSEGRGGGRRGGGRLGGTKSMEKDFQRGMFGADYENAQRAIQATSIRNHKVENPRVMATLDRMRNGYGETALQDHGPPDDLNATTWTTDMYASPKPGQDGSENSDASSTTPALLTKNRQPVQPGSMLARAWEISRPQEDYADYDPPPLTFAEKTALLNQGSNNAQMHRQVAVPDAPVATVPVPVETQTEKNSRLRAARLAQIVAIQPVRATSIRSAPVESVPAPVAETQAEKNLRLKKAKEAKIRGIVQPKSIKNVLVKPEIPQPNIAVSAPEVAPAETVALVKKTVQPSSSSQDAHVLHRAYAESFRKVDPMFVQGYCLGEVPIPLVPCLFNFVVMTAQAYYRANGVPPESGAIALPQGKRLLIPYTGNLVLVDMVDGFADVPWEGYRSQWKSLLDQIVSAGGKMTAVSFACFWYEAMAVVEKSDMFSKCPPCCRQYELEKLIAENALNKTARHGQVLEFKGISPHGFHDGSIKCLNCLEDGHLSDDCSVVCKWCGGHDHDCEKCAALTGKHYALS